MKRKMSWQEAELIYGLNSLHRSWSTAKIRQILNAKWPHHRAKNYFYAELLKRKFIKS